jgi:hypothetical protein
MSVAPWVDEVMQVDAGVNLYFGNGWVSTAWPSQSQHDFWAANNPAYTLFVYLWICIFGFSAVAVRSLNYVLALVITWLIVDTTKRTGALVSVWAPILLAALLICNQAFTFVYRSGRADLVTMFTVVLLFRIYSSVHDPARRRILLFLCATPLLASGLHSIPYAVLLLCLEYLFSRKVCISDVAAIGFGCVAGGFAMAGFFFWKHSLTAYVSQTFASGYNIVGAGLQAAILRDNAAVSRFLVQVKALSPVSVLQTIIRDTSALPLILYLLCLTILLLRAKQSRLPALRSTVLAGLTAALLVPYGMLAAGRYPFYYSWMAAAPVTVAFSIALEQSWLARKRLLIAGGFLAGTASILLGMPSEVWRDEHGTGPGEYDVVERILRHETQAGDAVYGDPVLYYAAKAANIPFFSTSYAGGRGYRRMTDEERSRISVLILAPEQVAESFEKVGSRWTQQRIYQSPYGSSLVVYKRTTSGSHSE